MAPDLTARASEADGTLSKFSVKPDGATEDTYIYETQIVFPINNSADAQALETLIPGARDTYIRATERDDWKCQGQVVVPAISGAHVELADAKTGRVAVKGGADIQSATYRASKKAVALTVKVRFGGMTAGMGAAFIGLLRAPIHFVFEAAQRALPFAGTAKAVVVPERGDIVCADDQGETVWGRVVEVDDEAEGEPAAIVLDDFGIEHTVSAFGVKSFWKLQAADDMPKLITSFKGRCTRRKVTPSWSHITVAVGEAFGGASGVPGDGAHTLTSAIIERAADVAGGKTSAPVASSSEPEKGGGGEEPAKAADDGGEATPPPGAVAKPTLVSVPRESAGRA